MPLHATVLPVQPVLAGRHVENRDCRPSENKTHHPHRDERETVTHYLDDADDNRWLSEELHRLAMADYRPQPESEREPEPIPANGPKFLCILVALSATVYSVIALFTGLSSDSTVSIIVAILALGGVFLIDHLDYERQRRAEYRDAVWARRERD